MSCAVSCGKQNRFRTQNQYLVPQMEGELVRKLASAVRARPGTIYFLSGNNGKNIKTRRVKLFCFYGRPSFQWHLSGQWNVLQLLPRTLSKKGGWLVHMLLKADIYNAKVIMELDDGEGWTGIWESPWPGADSGFVGPEAYKNSGVLFKKKNKILGTNVNIYLGWEKITTRKFKKKKMANTTNVIKSRKWRNIFII